jgi:hypothetical protein
MTKWNGTPEGVAPGPFGPGAFSFPEPWVASFLPLPPRRHAPDVQHRVDLLLGKEAFS